MIKHQHKIDSDEQMVALGARLAVRIRRPALILLEGPLGAGKTTWARGFLQALGHVAAVKSPTYTIVEPYEVIGGVLYHFDLYRLHAFTELDEMGFTDYFDTNAICLVEWPEIAQSYLPAPDISCKIDLLPHGRLVTVCAKEYLDGY